MSNKGNTTSVLIEHKDNVLLVVSLKNVKIFFTCVPVVVPIVSEPIQVPIKCMLNKINDGTNSISGHYYYYKMCFLSSRFKKEASLRCVRGRETERDTNKVFAIS